MIENCDIAVIGGGPVGAAFALAMKTSGMRVTVLEARPAEDTNSDPRALALSYGSRLLLTQIGIWQHLAPVTAIQSIHISQKNSFGRTRLSSEELKVPDLGYVIPYAGLQTALHDALKSSPVTLHYGASVTGLIPFAQGAEIHFQQANGGGHQLRARLVVVADGGKLLESRYPAEVHDYGQSAFITHVNCSHPQANTAFERFTSQGPLALLPYQGGYELVWTASHSAIQSMLSLDDASLLAQLQLHFGDRVGVFQGLGTRATFPLRLKRAHPASPPFTVLIGNAAQTLHPVAGQGFNLGLRDAWELAQQIIQSPETLGSAAMVSQYTRSRSLDRSAGIRFTDSLVRLFSNQLPVLGPARAASLSLLDCLPGVKKFVAKRMMFGANG